MSSINKVKLILLSGFTLCLIVWAISSSFSQFSGITMAENLEMIPNANADEYVGSESCKACHEDQFNSFSETKHSKLAQLPSWKGKVQGCEGCHGPGRAHTEDATDKTKIISFKDKNSKQISETCLGCHAGKESHNNFRRGEHWRNDVGCTDCHTAHGPNHGDSKTDSISFIGDVSKQKPNEAAELMLKASEPQLCLKCHTEAKAQFSKPFRHKVLEGTMKCSDCHNAHGGFESKQTKLAAGVDASCVKCHAEKQGPFVFEHAPLKVEGCSACHTPHGSSNPKLLKRPQVRQLCLECHSGITEQLAEGPTGGPHSQTSIRSTSCTVCHAAIHGSNTSNVYFR
ncbi:MAG TPA: DmsE family decaheme c-type cytochrome [Pyrinomonadaceae bacterium]|nr:DmsE family decaheme c-type cytochrome [Pyrinomonadaceae bacterium]